jgi:hypothetical protein
MVMKIFNQNNMSSICFQGNCYLLLVIFLFFLPSCSTIEGSFSGADDQPWTEEKTAESEPVDRQKGQLATIKKVPVEGDMQNLDEEKHEPTDLEKNANLQKLQDELSIEMNFLESQGCKTIVPGDKGVYVCAMKNSDQVSWAVANALSYAIKVHIEGTYNFKMGEGISRSYELSLEPGELSHDLPGSIKETFDKGDSLKGIKAKVSWSRAG